MENLKNFIAKNKNAKFSYGISKANTLGVGGKVHFYFIAESVNLLKKAVKLSYLEKVPVIVIGSGTNILFNEGFLDILLIKLGNYFKKIEVFPNGEIKVGAACNLGKFIVKAAIRGSDFSFLAGIPGTIGGAVKGNSGTKDFSICKCVKRIEYISIDGKLMEIDIDKDMHDYRKLLIKNISVITSIILKGKKGHKKNIFDSIRQRIKQKKNSQPLNTKNAGCFFKNPDGDSAGKLIEESGLKGFRYGGAAISKKHANFLINYDNASAEDIFILSLIVNEIVRDRFGINLQNEVKMIGFSR